MAERVLKESEWRSGLRVPSRPASRRPLVRPPSCVEMEDLPVAREDALAGHD